MYPFYRLLTRHLVASSLSTVINAGTHPSSSSFSYSSLSWHISNMPFLSLLFSRW